MDGVISFFARKKENHNLLATIVQIEDKLDDRYDQSAECEKLGVSNHQTTSFTGDGIRPPLVEPLPGIQCRRQYTTKRSFLSAAKSGLHSQAGCAIV